MKKLEEEGVVTLHNFLKPETIKELVQEAKSHSGLAYFTNSTHNVYLTTRNETLSPEHVFNRQLTSSKGCITTDQIPGSSKLKQVEPIKSLLDDSTWTNEFGYMISIFNYLRENDNICFWKSSHLQSKILTFQLRSAQSRPDQVENLNVP